MKKTKVFLLSLLGSWLCVQGQTLDTGNIATGGGGGFTNPIDFTIAGYTVTNAADSLLVVVTQSESNNASSVTFDGIELVSFGGQDGTRDVDFWIMDSTRYGSSLDGATGDVRVQSSGGASIGATVFSLAGVANGEADVLDLGSNSGGAITAGANQLAIAAFVGNNNSLISPVFTNATQGSAFTGQEHGSWTSAVGYNLNTGAGLDISVTSSLPDADTSAGIAITVIPEPGSLALVALAGIGLLTLRHKR